MTPRLNRRLFGALLASAVFVAMPVAAQTDPIKIGYNGDQSATAGAELGLAGRYGMEAAIEDINAKGGVLGRKLMAVVRDDTASPPKSIQNMNELIDNEKVVAVLGPTNSGPALAWLHIPQQKKVPIFSHIATATEITGRYAKEPQNYIFRISMVDREQMALLAAYAVKASKDRKIAIIADTTGYGQAASKDLQEILALHGVTPVGVEKYGPKDTDMTSQLAKLRAAGADIIISGSLADATANILKSMEKMDWFPGLLSGWASINSPLVNIAGPKLAEKTIFTVSATADANPRSEALAARLTAKYPNIPTFVAAAQGYDSVLLLAAAIAKANTTDGAKVAAALEDLGPVEGVIKSYDKPFSKTNHEALGVADFQFAQWKDGAVRLYSDPTAQSLKAADLKR
ncbi:ABC transporter substrate-binding protein [Azospirillum doebereinerae]